jgi:predicted RNA-binding Zn ribbon-like protein
MAGSGVPDLVGGHVALDLVNTVSWRLDPARTVDRVPDFAALLAWCRRAGVVDAGAADAIGRAAAGDPPAAERSARAARRLRERVYEVLAELAAGGASAGWSAAGGEPPALAAGGEPLGAALRALRPALADAVRHAELTASVPTRWWIDPATPADVPRVLALATLELLGSAAARAVSRCEGAGCGWLFLDHSRNHSRRWCSAGDCGNRERARRHYARTRLRAGQ